MASPNRAELDDMLRATLDDRRLSRTERRALKEVFADYDLSDEDRAFVRNRVFAMARDVIRHAQSEQVLAWAEEVIKVLQSKPTRDPTIAEVHFSPGDECRLRIGRLLNGCSRTADICVFTITDDRLASYVLEAHNRGVSVRIVTDDEKAGDRGSDVYRLAAAGVKVRVDESEHHMHHKFAVFDSETVLTGSYNWTRSAAEHNRENVIVTDDPKIVAPYQRNFEQLWEEFAPVHVPARG
jgi:phosphatidylserine/phosphatidylglycerophosphate/cardiolipin synthase-like enzyme